MIMMNFDLFECGFEFVYGWYSNTCPPAATTAWSATNRYRSAYTIPACTSQEIVTSLMMRSNRSTHFVSFPSCDQDVLKYFGNVKLRWGIRN